ncbi:MAG: exo-alpha-sialidase [Chitinispirillaceae bacterium]|nr:exo-alpha-sialidase [Chitinispirillaceae bacterium]
MRRKRYLPLMALLLAAGMLFSPDANEPGATHAQKPVFSKADSAVAGSNKRRVREPLPHQEQGTESERGPSAAVYGSYPNIRVDNATQNFRPQEMCIAINPANPNNLVAGSNKRYYYYSFDRGRTWTGKAVTSQYNMCGDPCVVFDATGVVYYGHISEPASYWPDRIVVHKSTDGGATWSHESGIGYRMLTGSQARNQDKEWLAVDLSDSPYKNSVYVSWTEFDKYDSNDPAHKTRIRFSCSRDKGSTWSEPVVISDTLGGCLDNDDALEGAVPAVGPDGEVYECWAGFEKLYFDKSLDGGETFGRDKIIADQPGGWNYPVSGIQRCNGMPIICADISATEHRGNIYVNWSDQRNGANNTDVFFIKSTDGGETWSSPKKVNSDNSNRHQFFCWMCVDPVTASIYIVFYDRRNTSGDATEVCVARSRDGGETFDNVIVSQSAFTPVSSVFFGDYTGIAAYGGNVYPIWMRMDNSSLSAWMAIMTEQVPVAGGQNGAAQGGFQVRETTLHQDAGRVDIAFTVPGAAAVQCAVFSMAGKHVASVAKRYARSGNHTLALDASKLAPGAYFYRLSAGSASVVQRFCVY